MEWCHLAKSNNSRPRLGNAKLVWKFVATKHNEWYDTLTVVVHDVVADDATANVLAVVDDG